MTGAAGLNHPDQLCPHHAILRERDHKMVIGEAVCAYLPKGSLLRKSTVEKALQHSYRLRWERAPFGSFQPLDKSVEWTGR